APRARHHLRRLPARGVRQEAQSAHRPVGRSGPHHWALRRGAHRGAQPRAQRRPDAAADRGAAQRHRLRRDLAPRPQPCPRASGRRRLMGLRLPQLKHLGPLLLAWAVSILIMVREKDLGSSLLFFAVFAAMLYMATERATYLLAGFGMFLAGAYASYESFGH